MKKGLTMKNNNHNSKRHRESSPSFQGTDQGPSEWAIGLKSMNQPSDESPYIQMLDQLEDHEEEWIEQASDVHKSKGIQTGQDSFDDTEYRRNQDDEYRWLDDGGESG
jgi:hypothetical protein